VDDGLEHVVDAGALLGRAEDRFVGVESQILVDLLPDLFDVGRRQIDLVDHRHQLQVVLQRQVEVGQGLSLHPLGGVDQQQRPFARHQGAPHLVREIDMAGGVDQVELVLLAVLGLVDEGHGVALDGDAALALDVHRVENLIAELAVFDPTTALDQAIGQRGLAVVDVGDDAEIANSVQNEPLTANPAAVIGSPTILPFEGAGRAEPNCHRSSVLTLSVAPLAGRGATHDGCLRLAYSGGGVANGLGISMSLVRGHSRISSGM
jgi:hypothetical protein